jgi:hypothetical protein
MKKQGFDLRTFSQRSNGKQKKTSPVGGSASYPVWH